MMMDAERTDLLERIDHTEARTAATYRDIRRLCFEADSYGFRAVVVHPIHCACVAEHLRGSHVAIVALIGFPTGAFTIEGKAFEAQDALDRGATEIEYVLNVGALRGGRHRLVREEMRTLREITAGHTLRAILETRLLSDAETRLSCELAIETGIDSVVTSTGLAPDDIPDEGVRRIRETVGDAFEVKAVGGIRSVGAALAAIRAGATLLGSEDGVRVVQAQASTPDDPRGEGPR